MRLLSLVTLCCLYQVVFSQSILNQDFESPIPSSYSGTDWYVSCSCIVQNFLGHSPHSGFGMMEYEGSPSTYSSLYTPEFTKGNAPYYVSYWVNLSDNIYVDYLNVELQFEKQNGSWDNAISFITLDESTLGKKDQWVHMQHTIPAGYNQDNYRVKFWGRGDFLLDDVKIIPGFPTNTVELNNSTVEIFPNPIAAGEDIYIKYKNPTSNLKLFISDLSGKKNEITPLQLANNSITVPTNGLSPGIYFLSISEEKKLNTYKILLL